MARSNDVEGIRHQVAITPHDTNTITPPVCVYVGGSGDLKVTLEDDSAGVVLVGVVAGNFYPIHPKLVWSTGTTATNLVAWY